MVIKVRSDQVKRALSIRHNEDFFITECKTGPTHTNNELLIFDALAVKKSWANPCITGYEVKVERSDFLRDNKWPGYMAYCNQLSFVCQTGLIALEELPVELGLIYYNPDKGSLTTKRKALYRKIDIPENLIYYILMNRLESERHPFFSKAREYFESFRADKAERKQLGNYAGIEIYNKIKGLNEKIKELERKVQRGEWENDFKENVKNVLKECGISTNYGWEDRLKARLSVGASEELKTEIQRLKQAVDRVNEIVR